MDNITTINLGACPLQYLSIGYVGETGARPVAFDFSAWATEYGSGVLQMLLQRPGDAEPYPVVLDIDSTTATWTPDATDTEKTGQGQAQLVYTVNGVVVKNAVFRVLIAPSLGAAGDPPEPYEDWLQRLLTIAAEAQQSAIDAAGSAEDAEQSAEDAAAAKTDAETAKTAAENAAAAAGVSAGSAAEKAAQAAQSAQAAAQKATDAQQSAEDTRAALEAARLAADAAETFKDDAQTAAAGANQAKTGAEAAARAAAGSAAAAAAAVTEVESKGAQQIQAIEAAGTDQIAAVGGAGAVQVQAIEDKGAEVLASIPADYTELSADVDGLDDAMSAFHGLTDYAGDDFNYSGTPGTRDSTCLAAKRTGMTVVLNGGNISASTENRQNAYLKLTGKNNRTNNSNTVKGWTNGIQLEAGKLYLVTCKFVSGTTTGASYPGISVYRLGEASTIGYDYRDGGTHYRYFAAPDGLVNIVLRIPCKDTLYTDYTVFVTLQEVDTTKVPDGYENINLYPMLWFTGGIGSNGDNYARNTSIRTSGYLDLDNVYSIVFTAGVPFYLALYDEHNGFLARSDQTGVIFTDAFKHAYPTAKKFRLEMRGVDGDRDAYSNCVIYGKHSIYGFIDKQDTKKEMAAVLIQHRTTSEQYGRTNLTALIVTDVHSEMQRLGALLATMERWGLDYFDAIINCGDTALTLQSNYPGSYDKNMSYIDRPKINVVGNHDSYSTLGTVGPQATTYNLVIAPIAEQEGLVQPTDAAANSLCYYYYDVNGIRIIALDCMYWNAAEATWLESVLADAAASSKPVICVSHYGFKEAYAEWIPSLWKPYASYPSDMINIAAAEKVKDFIDGGGTFLCWLVGHSHQDNLYRLKAEYGGQLVVTFPSLAQRAGNLLKNEDIDTYNYSCGTFMAVDLYQHNIRFLRLGADIDTVGVRHRGLSLNYLTGELFGAWS